MLNLPTPVCQRRQYNYNYIGALEIESRRKGTREEDLEFESTGKN